MDNHMYCGGCGIHSGDCPCFGGLWPSGIVCAGQCPGPHHLVNAREALKGPVATRVADSIKRASISARSQDLARKYTARGKGNRTRQTAAA